MKSQLIEGVQQLEKAGSDLIIIGCNTVHCYYDEMQNAVKVPIFNIIEETKKQVLDFKYKKIGLFASESTNQLQLYQKSFKEAGIEVISANKEQQKVLNWRYLFQYKRVLDLTYFIGAYIFYIRREKSG